MDKAVIESELKDLSQKQKKNWQRITYLLITFSDAGLFRPEHANFSKWLRAFARDIGLHEATFWNYYSVGTYYMEKTGTSADDLLSLHVSPKKLGIVKKIEGREEQTGTELFARLMKDDPALTTPHLQEIWEQIKDGITSTDSKVREAEDLANKLRLEFDTLGEDARRNLFAHIVTAVTEKGARDVFERAIALRQIASSP